MVSIFIIFWVWWGSEWFSNLDSFEINQGVNSYSGCFVVRLIGLSPELCPILKNKEKRWRLNMIPRLSKKNDEDRPPWSGPHSESRVCHHRQSRNSRKIPSKFVCLKGCLHFMKTREVNWPERTKMPHTIEISKAVGTIRNIIDCRRNVIPLE